MSVKVCVQLNPHTRTHAHIQRIHPGVAILKRDWAGAVELVLRPRAGEDARCQDVRVVDGVKGCEYFPCKLQGIAYEHNKTLKQLHNKIKARDYWAETKDAKGALALMPRHMSIEQAVLRVLDKQGPQVGSVRFV